MGAPASALPDQLDLGRALPHEHAFDLALERNHARSGDLAQRRTFVAEDPRIAVLVGADGANPEIGEHARKDPHRVLDTRVLGIRLDPLEVGLGPDPLDLELRNEHDELAGAAPGERDRTLRREEAEVGEVPDVVLVEEHVPGCLDDGPRHAGGVSVGPRIPRPESFPRSTSPACLAAAPPVGENE